MRWRMEVIATVTFSLFSHFFFLFSWNDKGNCLPWIHSVFKQSDGGSFNHKKANDVRGSL